MVNPKILHRVYFDDMPPYEDWFLHFLDTWKKEMPEYTIMQWNKTNLPNLNSPWCNKAFDDNAPVFLSEYYRWWVLKEYGGMYIDADCEILNGKKLHNLIEDLYNTSEYEGFIGIESADNGRLTVQTMALKPNSKIANFMLSMYDDHLASPLYHWKNQFIGPTLISLYFLENGYKPGTEFIRVTKPEVHLGLKIYPQEYFSPKFSLIGKNLLYTDNTCIYHLFANLNMDVGIHKHLREKPLRFHELQEHLKNTKYIEIIKNNIINTVNKILPHDSNRREFIKLISKKIYKLNRNK